MLIKIKKLSLRQPMIIDNTLRKQLMIIKNLFKIHINNIMKKIQIKMKNIKHKINIMILIIIMLLHLKNIKHITNIMIMIRIIRFLNSTKLKINREKRRNQHVTSTTNLKMTKSSLQVI